MSPFISPPAIISILLAISIHEAAHAFVAKRLGDPTADYAGRITLNPLAHLDPVGALMFLIVGFGWAKPVPVDPRYFSHPKRDNALVALAGPLSNLILATIAFIGLVLVAPLQSAGNPLLILEASGEGSVIQIFLQQVFASSLFINLALMAFNLLPIAPLDGSKILHMFIPLRHEDQYETIMERGPMILLILILAGMFLNFPLLTNWVLFIVQPVLQLMLTIAQFFL